MSDLLKGIVLGTANQQRLARDDEVLDVEIVSMEPHVNIYENQETWRAWNTKLRPLDRQVADIKIRFFLDKKQDFVELGDAMRALTTRISNFADAKYGVTEFTLNDVIGTQLKIRHIRKDPNKPSQIALLQVESVPTLDPDVEHVQEVEQVEDKPANTGTDSLAFELNNVSPFKHVEVND